MKCKVYKCKAMCCYNIVLPIGFLDSHKDDIINTVLSVRQMPFNPRFPLSELVITDIDPNHNKCPFLRDDYKCNVYNDRPDICRIFGEITELPCKYRKRKDIG